MRYQERFPGVPFQMLVGFTAPLVMAEETDLLLAHVPAPTIPAIESLSTGARIISVHELTPVANWLLNLVVTVP
jgi:hypothetical protein